MGSFMLFRRVRVPRCARGALAARMARARPGRRDACLSGVMWTVLGRRVAGPCRGCGPRRCVSTRGPRDLTVPLSVVRHVATVARQIVPPWPDMLPLWPDRYCTCNADCGERYVK